MPLPAEVDRELLRLYKEDPGKLDALENGLKELRMSVEAKKEGKAAPVKRAISDHTNLLKADLAELQRKQAEYKANEARLEQLASAGDERSIIEFFEGQGMDMDEIRRALSGDAQGALEELAKRQPADPDVDKNLKLVNDLGGVLKGDTEPTVEAPPAPETVRPPPEPKLPETKVIQPDFRQSFTASSVVVTVTLPKLSGAKDVDLDVAEKHLRLRAPVPGAQDDDHVSEYMLNVPLTKRVDTAGASAKWRAKQTELVVTLPRPQN